MGFGMENYQNSFENLDRVAGSLSATRLIDDTTPEKRAQICEAVIDLCSALFNVSGHDLRQANRCSQGIARVRQIAMYLCNTTLGVSLTEIGKAICRDRTTVSHAVQLIEDLRDDAEFDAIMEQVERVTRIAFVGEVGRHG
jgi:chromosomal replication initiation ATPase DnaA